MDNMKTAEKYYQYFSKTQGNQHIASLFALEMILDIVESNRPRRILEIGLGIGSISYSIIDYLLGKGITDFEYYGTESNDFCLTQLPLNLKKHYSRVNLFPDLDALPENLEFDLVIVDGSDDSIGIVSNCISTHGVIFIEGDRKLQQDYLRGIFPRNKYVHCISNYREPAYGPFITGTWSGGGKLIYVNPTFRQMIIWFGQKIRTSYRFRVTRKSDKN